MAASGERRAALSIKHSENEPTLEVTVDDVVAVFCPACDERIDNAVGSTITGRWQIAEDRTNQDRLRPHLPQNRHLADPSRAGS